MKVGIILTHELGDEAGCAIGRMLGAAGDKFRSGAANFDQWVRGAIQAYSHAQG
jgi:hypothetical protein